MSDKTCFDYISIEVVTSDDTHTDAQMETAEFVHDAIMDKVEQLLISCIHDLVPQTWDLHFAGRSVKEMHARERCN